MLKKKTQEDMRRTQKKAVTQSLKKLLRIDELNYIKKYYKSLTWIELTKIINKHRPEGYLITHTSVQQQSAKRGMIKNNRVIIKAEKLDKTKYFDYKEFDWYYK